MFCLNSPESLATDIAIKISNPEEATLTSISSVQDIIVQALQDSQVDWATLTPENRAKRADITSMEEFLARFMSEFKIELEAEIDPDDTSLHSTVLKQAQTTDWAAVVSEDFTNFLSSNQEPNIDFDVPASDETVEQLVNQQLDESELINVDDYTDYLLVLAKTYLTGSANPNLNIMPHSALAAGLAKFIDSATFLAMVDTRDSENGGGFSTDKAVIISKLATYTEDIIKANPTAMTDDVINTDSALSNIAMTALYANILNKHLNNVMDLALKDNVYDSVINFDHANISSDMYLDQLSLMVMNNTPRLVPDPDMLNSYSIDKDNPTLSSKEIKNTVAPLFATLESNTIEHIRAAMSASTDPIIQSVYQYYFSSDPNGFTLFDQSGQKSKRYSVSYAIEQAYQSRFGETGVDSKFASFDMDNMGLFKNRLISAFTSIQAADRVTIANGRIKFASDAANNTENAYLNNLEHSLLSGTTSSSHINPEISSRISFTKVANGNLNLVINKINPVTNKTEILLSVDVALESKELTLDKLKGRLVSVARSADNAVYKDRNSAEHKNLLEALNALGFPWTNRIFLDEYYKNNASDGKTSLLNLVANLAMANTLNDDTLRSSLETSIKGISDLQSESALEDGTVNEGLRFEPKAYIHEFLGNEGTVTKAIGTVYNHNNIFNYKSQEGENAAATVAPTLVATKQKVINKVRKLLARGKASALDGNLFVGQASDINEVSAPTYRITKRAVKEGMDQYGNSYLLADMTAADRVASLITMGVASMVNYTSTNLNKIIIQPHQYADKKVIDIFEVERVGSEALIPIKDGAVDLGKLRERAADSHRQQLFALQSSIIRDWSAFFSKPAVIEFSRNADKASTAALVAQFQNSPPQNLIELSEFLAQINLDPAFVTKSTDLLEHRTFTIKDNQVIVKKSLLRLEDTITNLASEFVQYNNNNFMNTFNSAFSNDSYTIDPDLRRTLSSKLGLAKTLSVNEIAEVYHLIHQEVAPQLESLTMGHLSQFGASENVKIDFSKVKNDFKSEEEFQQYLKFLELETMLSPQEKAKSKRTSQTSTNGVKVSILGKTEYGQGVGEFFHYVTIDDPKLTEKLITQNIEGFDSHDGIRLGLDITRLQVNAALGGDAAMSSKGESRKDSLASFDEVDASYRLQKMSTMYLTPEFIRNSPESHSIIKRMLSAVPYPDEAKIFTAQGQEIIAANGWELVMSLQGADPTLTLDNPALWEKFQEVESLSPEIRGEYISYAVLKTVEKTGSRGIEDSSTLYGHNSDYRKGDKVQWTREGDGLVYESGTVIDVVQDSAAEVLAIEEELNTLRQNLVKEVVMAAPTEQKFINVSSDKIAKLNEGLLVSVSKAPGVKLTEGINKLPDGSLVDVSVANVPKIDQLSNPDLWAQTEGYRNLYVMQESIVSPHIRNFLDGKAGLTIYTLRKHISRVNNNPYMGIITELEPNQVFVFGANAAGLHGLGAAASAMGQKRSLSDIKKVKDGTKGKWAIKGETDLMRGYDGTSYGLVTVEYPGRNKADTRLPEDTITANIQKMYKLANDNPELEYLVAYNNDLDKKSLNGYTGAEMIAMFNAAGEIPTNIRFSQEWTETGLLNFVKSTNPEAQKPKSIEDFYLMIGGTNQATDPFAKIGKEYGLVKVSASNAAYYKKLSPELNVEVNAALGNAAIALERPMIEDEKYAGKLLRLNYLQIKAADALFAVGSIVNSGKKGPKGFKNEANKQVIDGNAGLPVEMAIQLKKPVYVFDQTTNQWHAWDPIGQIFTPLDKAPVLTPKFVGAGTTSEMTPAGEAAIADLYQSTILELDTPAPDALYATAEVAPLTITEHSYEYLKQLPVHTQDGINTIRTPVVINGDPAKAHEHFGNMFTASEGKPWARKVGPYTQAEADADPNKKKENIRVAVNAYRNVIKRAIEAVRTGKIEEAQITTITEGDITPDTIVPVTYTRQGQSEQEYTVVKDKIYNKNGKEVFKADSSDRMKIFGKAAIARGDAQVVTLTNGDKYIVNRDNKILSVKTGKIMAWDENHGLRVEALNKVDPNAYFTPRVRYESTETRTVIPGLTVSSIVNPESRPMDAAMWANLKKVAETPGASYLVDLVQKVIKRNNVKVQISESSQIAGGSVQLLPNGEFIITINPNNAELGFDNNEIIFHELLHVVTTEYLKTDPEANEVLLRLQGYFGMYQDLIGHDAIEKFMQEEYGEVNVDTVKAKSAVYAATSFDEFIVGFMTNQNVRDVFETQDKNTLTGLLNRIVEIIQNVFAQINADFSDGKELSAAVQADIKEVIEDNLEQFLTVRDPELDPNYGFGEVADLTDQAMWIAEQIESGALDNKQLLYLDKNGQDFESHADALAGLVHESMARRNVDEVVAEPVVEPNVAPSTEQTTDPIQEMQSVASEIEAQINEYTTELAQVEYETSEEALALNPIAVILKNLQGLTSESIKNETNFNSGWLGDIGRYWVDDVNGITLTEAAERLYADHFNHETFMDTQQSGQQSYPFVPGMDSMGDVQEAIIDMITRTKQETLDELNQVDYKREIKYNLKDAEKRLTKAQKALDDLQTADVKYAGTTYTVTPDNKIVNTKGKDVAIKKGSEHHIEIIKRAEDIRKTKAEAIIKELGFAQPTKEDLESNEFDMPRAVVASTDIAQRIQELEARLNLLKEASDGTIIQVVKPSQSDPYAYDKLNLRINPDGSMVEMSLDGEQQAPLREVFKSFNYKTESYNNYSIVLNAGKDAEYKGGVAKMTQAFNSVLFNNEYVNDALNMIQAQGSMATSNLNKLKEEFTILTIDAVLAAEEINGVMPEELSRIKILFDKLLEQPAAYQRNKATIEEFLQNPDIQKLGYKAFVVQQAKKKNLDPDLFTEIKKSNYSFSGATTNMMFQVFSTAIEQATVKSRFAGQNFILAPAEDMLKTYEYRGAKMLRSALIKELIRDNKNESLRGVDDAMKSVFLEGLNLQPFDVIIKDNSEVYTVQSLLDANVHIAGDSDVNAYLVALLSDPTQNYSYLRLSEFKESKLAAPKVITPEGDNITDTVEHESYLYFKDQKNRKEPLTENVFNIYKTLSNTLPYAEYDFFRQYETYNEYMADPTKSAVGINPILSSQVAVDRFLLELQQNTYMVNGKANLHTPVQLDVFDPEGTITNIMDLIGAEQLAPVSQYLNGLGISLDEAFNLQNVNSPEDSNTHATIQENVLNMIDLREVAEINEGVEIPTPAKSAQAALITELQSTRDNEPKYHTTKGEIVIPFVYAKEFGFESGEVPTVQDVVGTASSRDQAVINARDFFNDRKRGINFPRLHANLVEGMPGEPQASLFERNIQKYKLILMEELVLAKASTGSGADSFKAETIQKVLDYLDTMGTIDEDGVGVIVNYINRQLIENSNYGRFVRNNRAEAFVDYLEVFYGRIPGTGIQSNGVGNTVGFVQDMGNTAFVHHQNGMISGSDFDIDKITTILRAIDNNGIAYSYTEWLDTNNQVYTIAEEFAKDPQSITLENLQNLAGTISSADFESKLEELTTQYEASLFGTNSFRDSKRDIRAVMTRSLQFKTRYRNNFEKAMQNYILDQIKQITQATDIQFEAQTIVTTDTMADAKNIGSNKRLSVALTADQKTRTNSLTSPFNLMSQMELEEENRIGEISIGMYANGQKILANTQQGINALKKAGNPDAGKFKKPLNIVIQRPTETVVRVSYAIANTLETTTTAGGAGFKASITFHEDAAIKRAINDIRAENADLTITDIFQYIQVNNEALSEQYGVNSLADAWSKKMMHIASTKGWEAIGQFIQASTDNAKVLLLGPIGANLTTNSYFATMLIGGFNIYDTIEFLSNPKISATSLIYEHFNKNLLTPFNLKTIFGDNIPPEYKKVFKPVNGLIRTLPADLAPNMALFLRKLKDSTRTQDSIYSSMSSIIQAEEEVQVMNSVIGLDVSQPNSLSDTINKMRTIGGAMLKILKRGKNSSYVDDSPVELLYKYLTNDEARKDIEAEFYNKTGFINALDILNTGPFKIYLQTLGDKIEMTNKLSYLPEAYMNYKFSGFKSPTFREAKDIENILYGFGAQTYITEVSDEARALTLNNGETYDLRDQDQQIRFLEDFLKDSEALGRKYKSAIFNMLKYDSDLSYDADTPKRTKYLGLLINQNTMADELAFIKTSIEEMKQPSAAPELANFYTNLKYYTLITEKGLASKAGLFQFVQTDLTGYNEHLEIIVNDPVMRKRLADTDEVTVQLNAPHLIPAVDTSKRPAARVAITEEDLDPEIIEQRLLEQEQQMMEEEEKRQIELEEGTPQFTRRKSVYDLELHLKQRAPLYRSKHSNRVYYNALVLGHIALSPKETRKGRPMVYDDHYDSVLAAGWNYGIPVQYQGKTIYLLKTTDNDPNNYYYIDSMEEILMANDKANKDIENEKDTITVENTFKVISSAQLLKHNPDWVFRGNVFRKKTNAEARNKNFKSLNSVTFIPYQEDGGVTMDPAVIAQIENSTTNLRQSYQKDLSNFEKSTKAILAGGDQGAGLYIDAVLDKRKIHAKTYNSDDVVTIINDINKISDSIRKVVTSGATILTRDFKNRTSSDTRVVKYLEGKNYIEVDNDGVWIKDTKTRAQKMSPIPTDPTYRNNSTQISKKMFANVMARVNKLFPNIEVQALSTQEIKLEFGEAYAQYKGFVKDGVVYMNTDKMSLDTVYHEFGHIYMSWLKQNDLATYHFIVQEAHVHDRAADVAARYPELEGAALGEEIFVEMLGVEAAQFSTEPTLIKGIEKAKQWLQDMFRRLFNLPTLGIGENDTIYDMIEKAGRSFVFGSEMMQNITSDDVAMWDAGLRPSMSYAMIENNLIEQGFIKKMCNN